MTSTPHVPDVTRADLAAGHREQARRHLACANHASRPREQRADHAALAQANALLAIAESLAEDPFQ